MRSPRDGHDEDGPVPMVHADPRHRRLLVWSVLAFVVLGSAMVLLLSPSAEAWVERYRAEIATSSADELVRDYTILTLAVSLGLAAPLAILACWFLYQSYRVYEAKRFPYPGMWLLRDTPLETGERARRRARRFLAAAVFLLVAGGVMGGSMFRLLMGVLDSVGASVGG